MTSSSSRRRTTTSTALVLALGLSVAACGGSDDPKTTDDPTRTASVSQTPTPTPTPTEAPTPTPTEAPLSPFEDKAPVKAARRWAEATARAVNARDRSLAAVVPLTTSLGFAQTRDYFVKDDLDHGYVVPGPPPFTPVSLRVSGGVAKLAVCAQDKGWSRYRKTGKPVRKGKVSPFIFEVRRVGGAWKFDRYYAGTADCAGVRVRGVTW